MNLQRSAVVDGGCHPAGGRSAYAGGMRSKFRVVTVVATAVVPLLLVTACAGDETADGSGSNLTPITGSSYVTMEPATTTTTTTLPPVDPDTLQPGQTSPQEQTYTVRSGDSVSKIASLYGISGEVLANYNSWPEGIQHPIFPGDLVEIPPDSQVPDLGGATTGDATGDTTGDATGDTTGEPGETTTDGECPTTYVIQSGDTTRIGVADRFGITYQQMDAANVNTPGYQNFIVGTPITIPCP